MGNKKANTTLSTQETCAILAGLHLLQAFADDAVAIDGDGHFAWVVEATHKCDFQEDGLSEDEIGKLMDRINDKQLYDEEEDRLVNSLVEHMMADRGFFYDTVRNHVENAWSRQDYANWFPDLDAWCEVCDHPAEYQSDSPILCPHCEAELEESDK
jgi:hypothetical protein